MAEFLIEASEVESRLREHVMTLIEPTIKKQVIMDKKFKDVNILMQSNRHDIDDILSTRDAQESMNSVLDSFRVELAGWDKDRHEYEMKVSNRVSSQEAEINGLRQSLEILKGADHSSVQRTLQNMGDMLTQYKDESTDLRRFCTERIDISRDKMNKLRDEFETRTSAMESQMHRLQDMQTQTNTSIHHMNELNSVMDDNVKRASEGIADLWRAKVSIACLEEQQSDLSEFMQHVNGIVSSLKQQFGSLIDDVKAHFETATQLVGRSTAEQMNVMRTKYQDDLQRVDGLRTEMEKFVSSQKVTLEMMDVEVKSTRETTSSTLNDLRDAIDKLRRQREVDQKMAQIEAAQIHRDIKQALEASDSPLGARVGGGRSLGSHKFDALATFLESACIDLACELQDEQDRKGIALFGAKALPTDKGITLPEIAPKWGATPSPGSSPRKRAGIEKFTRSATSAGFGVEGASDQVVSIDNRCLSCAGSSATVLAGFKLACLRYESSQVEYAGVFYSRSELIRKRMELLEQARTALKQSSTQA